MSPSITEDRLWESKLRPACPLCGYRMRPRLGLADEVIFYCYRHDHWYPEPQEDDEGRYLPLFRWVPYEWRL